MELQITYWPSDLSQVVLKIALCKKKKNPTKLNLFPLVQVWSLERAASLLTVLWPFRNSFD